MSDSITNGRVQKTINHLIQLQELVVARAQQEVSMPGTRLSDLDSSIKTLIEDLPEGIGTLFTRLQRKDHLAIVPVSNQVCTACGMSLPVSFVQAVRVAEKLHQCPNCARIMYFPHSAVPRRETKPTAKRGQPPKVGIERFSSPALMIPQLSSTSRDDVIAELSTKLEDEGYIGDANKLTEEALKREAIVSTAVDHGLAFPHVRGVEGGGLTLALGVHPKGIKFGGPGRALTRIVFFIVIPTAASAFYLKLLSGLTQAFSKEEARKKVMEADKPEKLWKALARVTKTTIT